MKISVVTFARIKEVMGADRVELQVDSDATVADLKSLLLTQYPDLQSLMPHCNVAVDQEYADDQTALREGCEVGIIPPVSGG